MRLLKLSIMNLNSLEGQWEIDFTDPAYRNSPLFVIAGNTGAGKSTLLDAACLALYRETPRLGAVTGKTNEIMTRGTGECRAELTFEAKGRIWRSSFYQHRSRKRPGEALQVYAHSLVDAETGKPAPEAFEDAREEAERLTGLDFRRFTRCAVLPQNAFAAFLHSGASERSRIMEQITDTGIYGTISQKAYRRAAREAERLESLKAGLEMLELLDPDREAEIAAEIARLRGDAVSLEAAKAVREGKAKLRAEIRSLEDGLRGLRAKEAELDARESAFAPDRARLARANAAAGLEGLWGLAARARSVADAEGKALAGLKGRLPEAERALVDAEAKRGTAAAVLEKAQVELERGLPLIARARELDGSLAAAQATLKTLRDADGRLRRELDSLRRGIAADGVTLAENRIALDGL
ncbi:MAG: AAA family ATPase [Deltaproteobacteria bacterium]|nr:AAA family ATPase [Deltaproteobacteria bacterium]